MTLFEEKKKQFSTLLTKTISQNVEVKNIILQGGGCINKAAVLETSQGKIFVKWNYSSLKSMFETEVKGLALLRNTKEIFIPIGLEDNNDETFLFIEMVEPEKRLPHFWEDFGIRLAKIHRHTSAHFGLDHDNFIGSLKQINPPTSSWKDFFYHHRLLYQLEMAFSAHKINRSVLFHFENLYKRLDELIPNEKPALLHGDLWTGNILKAKDGSVCLIDPSVYYGHREMELAYTMLFDQNPDAFYEAYQSEFPLQKGYKKRADIYNLYPLLVHVNLFGGNYMQQVKNLVSVY